MSPPQVSVIIPTYNRACLIEKCIQSVVTQTFKDYEIIIVDDGSTDGTQEIVKSFQNKGVRYFKLAKNCGGAAARNIGIEAARGKYVAFLDSDDEWLPRKTEHQISILDQHEHFSVVYGNIMRIDADGSHKKVGFPKILFPSGDIYHDVLLHKSACGYLQTMMVRRECFDRVGLLDPIFRIAHDREFTVRLAREYHIYGIASPVTLVRQHDYTERVRGSGTENKEYYLNKFMQKLFEEDDPFLDARIRRQMISNYDLYFGLGYMSEWKLDLARQRLYSSIKNNPLKARAYLYLLLTFIGGTSLRRLRDYRRAILQAFIH